MRKTSRTPDKAHAGITDMAIRTVLRGIGYCTPDYFSVGSSESAVRTSVFTTPNLIKVEDEFSLN